MIQLSVGQFIVRVMDYCELYVESLFDFLLQSSSFEVDEEGYRIRPPDSESILVLLTSRK